MTKGHTAPRTIVSPILDTQLAGDGGADGLTFWKQILPETEIQYEGKTIAFTKNYLNDLEASFRDGALDQTPFLLADESNRHTMDPERFRAETVDMKQYEELPETLRAELAANPPKAGVKGLYAKLRFADAKAVEAVKSNPRLGVSARIREGIQRADGKTFKRAIIHVLGTLDPRVTGMSGWTPALDLSEYADANLLDLSSARYSEDSVPDTDTLTGKVTTLDDGSFEFDFENITEADIDDFTEEQLDAFLDQTAGIVGPEVSSAPATEPEPSPQPSDPSTPGTPAPNSEAALSAEATRDIQLANDAAAEALSRARAAEQRMADAEWRTERAERVRKGVPPFALDLAEPVLNRPDDMHIDLSNTGGPEDLDLSGIVRGLLDALEGTVDVDVELGHSGEQSDTSEVDAQVAAFREQYGI